MEDAIILYENGKAIGGEGHPTDASDITFDNSNTDLVSENVENAIVEVNAKTSGLTRMTTLWENLSPTASFSAQTITLSSDDYDMLLVIAKNGANINRAISVYADKGMGFVLTVCGPGTGNAATVVIRPTDYVNDTTFSVYNCSSAVGTTSTIDNNSLIPYIIYGIKLI